VKSVRQRQDERRDEKLREIQRQIDEGSLVVRKMTAAERAAHKPRAPRRKRA
jgi:hypothetical protein